MNKRIALGVASALLGVSGVAGASMAVTQSADFDNDNGSAGLAAVTDLGSLSCVLAVGQSASAGSCDSAAPGLAAATDLLADVPGIDALRAQAEGIVNNLSADLPVQDLSGMLDTVPSICDAPLPFSLPLPTRTLGAGMSFFGTLESMISEQLAFVSTFAPSTPTVLSLPDVLNHAKGEIACTGATGGSPLPVPVPVELDVCDITAGLGAALPAPAGEIIAGAVKDAAAMTGQNVAPAGDGVSVACDSSKAQVPVPASTQPMTVKSKPIPARVIPAAPIPAVAVPAVQVQVPMLGAVGTPAIDASAGVIPSITVGPVATPEIKLPALPLGSLLGGVGGSASANAGSGNLLGTLLNLGNLLG